MAAVSGDSCDNMLHYYFKTVFVNNTAVVSSPITASLSLYCCTFETSSYVCHLPGVLEVDISLDEKSVEDVSLAEQEIVSQFKEYIKQVLDGEQREKLLSKLAPLLEGQADVSIIIQKQNSLGVYFLCKTQNSLKQIRDLQKDGDLLTILKNIFTSLLKTSKTVGIKQTNEPITIRAKPIDESDYVRCDKYFQTVAGKLFLYMPYKISFILPL